MTRSLDMKLRVLRAERQLSLREASELTGVDKVSLSRFERGLAHPQDRTLGKIANGYGVPVEELLEEPVLSSGKAEAPTETGQEEERRVRALLEALAPRTEVLGELAEFVEAFVRGLPEEPTGEEYQRANKLYRLLSQRVRRINAELYAAGLAEAPDTLGSATDADKVQELQYAVDQLNTLRQELWVWGQRISETVKLHEPGLAEKQAEDWQRENAGAEKGGSA